MTLKETLEMKAKYKAAIEAVLKNQSYTIDTTTYTKANLATLQAQFDKLDRAADRMQRGGGMRVRRIAFRDD